MTTTRPVVQLLDLLGRRWTLRLLWELRDSTPHPFSELRDETGRMSTSVLSTRLGELVDARFVEKEDGGYRLTDEGAELLALLGPLEAFSRRWAAGQDC